MPAADTARPEKPSDSSGPEKPSESSGPEKPSDSASEKRRRPDGLPKSAYISSTDRRRTAMARYSAWATLAGLVAGTLYLGRTLDADEQRAHPRVGAGWDAFYERVRARATDFLSFYAEPPSRTLLPDAAPFGPKYTLVIALEDVLVHSEWTREHGWRTAKRPGLDYFIAYLFQYYEVVIFTALPRVTAEALVAKIDAVPSFISGALYRTDTRYVDGKYVKDLAYLNRDLARVVMLEANPDAWAANPDNTVKLPPWAGDRADKGLIDLIPFLEYLAAMGVADVRPVIRDYDGTLVPAEFARREALLREQLRSEAAAAGAHRKPAPPSWVCAMLGLKPKDAAPADDVKTFMDMARERGQQNYLLQMRHLDENREQILAEQRALEQAAAAGMKTSLGKIFTEASGCVRGAACRADAVCRASPSRRSSSRVRRVQGGWAFIDLYTSLCSRASPRNQLYCSNVEAGSRPRIGPETVGAHDYLVGLDALTTGEL